MGEVLLGLAVFLVLVGPLFALIFWLFHIDPSAGIFYTSESTETVNVRPTGRPDPTRVIREWEVSSLDPDLGWTLSIPIPFWERSWRTRFRWRAMCCDIIFKSESDYERHYIAVHHFGGADA